MSWIEKVRGVSSCLSRLSVRDAAGNDIETEDAFNIWTDLTSAARKSRRTVYLIGNGASASIASHISADLAKNAHVHTEVFSDLSLITAISNDMGYKEVFAEPLRRRMVPGDMLFCISSSGESENVIHAAKTAICLGGHVTTISAMDCNNTLRNSGMLNFYVPADTYGLAETCHAAILHHLVDQLTVALPAGDELKPVFSIDFGTQSVDPWINTD
ncbi:MAG: SIS domain-containing protein [Proteobacteria bacterium]|nr:SIS domain-containing protein [Pseudomonadota bacterium]